MTRKEDPGLLIDTLGLATRAKGLTKPNPLVGAVLVTPSGKKFQGYHPYHGGLHAEAVVLQQAGDQARGGVLYCSLEPCCHSSKEKIQPPCAQTIIQAGVSKVVIGQLDPNPKVRGGGVALLRQAGIEVELSQSIEDFVRINSNFNTVHLLNRPWVHLKAAITLDGKIANLDGQSKWITGPSLRQRVQVLRSEHDAIGVGRGTVAQDDPHLDLRPADQQSNHAQPLAVVFDRNLSISSSSYLVTQRPKQLIICCNKSSVDSPIGQKLTDQGVRLVPGDHTLQSHLAGLKALGIQSILIEGGAGLFTTFLSQGLWDEITLHIAPSLMGQGLSVAGPLGSSSGSPAGNPLNLLNLEDPTWESLDGHGICHGYRPGWLEELVRGLEHVYRAG